MKLLFLFLLFSCASKEYSYCTTSADGHVKQCYIPQAKDVSFKESKVENDE